MSIKQCFPSRWGKDGYLMEVDFSQLEVVALAILSKDPQLIEDLRSGKDMHRVRAAELYGIPEHVVSDEQRQMSKQLSFQLQYGAGAKSMAEKNSISIELAKRFINNYYARYPNVAAWHTNIAEEVKSSRVVTNEFTKAGKPKGAGCHMSATGRVYKFFEYDNTFIRFWGDEDTSFSATEMKNYPVQGLATGDIMALYRGRVYRRWLAEGLSETCPLVNTVHDSIMLDVPDKSMVLWAYRVMEEEAARLPQLLKDLWGIETELDFKVECKYGPTWAEMNKL